MRKNLSSASHEQIPWLWQWKHGHDSMFSATPAPCCVVLWLLSYALQPSSINRCTLKALIMTQRTQQHSTAPNLLMGLKSPSVKITSPPPWPEWSVLCLTPNVCLSPLCLHYPAPPPLLAAQLWRDNPTAPHWTAVKEETLNVWKPFPSVPLSHVWAPLLRGPHPPLCLCDHQEAAMVKDDERFKMEERVMWLETLGSTYMHEHAHASNWYHKEVMHPLRLQTRRTSSCDLLTEDTSNCAKWMSLKLTGHKSRPTFMQYYVNWMHQSTTVCFLYV